MKNNDRVAPLVSPPANETFWGVLRYAAVLSVALALAGQDNSGIAFEAASIKPFPTGTPIQMSGCLGGPGSDNPGRVECQYVTLRALLILAYKVNTQQIQGPASLDSDHFNIQAKIPAGAARDQVPLMYRSLLAERFHVALHREKRPLSVYSLTVSKGGIKLKEAAPPSPPAADQPSAGGRLPLDADGFPILRPETIAAGPIILFRNGRARLQASGATLSALAEALARQLDRIVIDNTGLTAKYAITLNWTPEAAETGARREPGAAHDALSAPDLFMALDSQLGLRLESKKVEQDTLIIDHADKTPVEN